MGTDRKSHEGRANHKSYESIVEGMRSGESCYSSPPSELRPGDSYTIREVDNGKITGRSYTRVIASVIGSRVTYRDDPVVSYRVPLPSLQYRAMFHLGTNVMDLDKVPGRVYRTGDTLDFVEMDGQEPTGRSCQRLILMCNPGRPSQRWWVTLGDITDVRGHTPQGTVHDLKTWPRYFQAVLDGTKTFEIRTTVDRTFHVGDTLLLREWSPESKDYSGRSCEKVVSYIAQGPPWLPVGTAVLGLQDANADRVGDVEQAPGPGDIHGDGTASGPTVPDGDPGDPSDAAGTSGGESRE